MPTIPIKPGDLGGVLRGHARQYPRAVRKGLISAARRGQAHMPKKGPTDQGQLRNSWRTRQVPDVALYNDAPHAGIVERGARPHPVSPEGIEALTGWAMRQLGLDAKQAAGVAQAIAARIRKEGQAPTYFVRAELAALGHMVPAEIARELARMLGGGGK